MNTVKGKVKDIIKNSGTSAAGKEWVKTTVVVQTPSEFSNIVPIEMFNKEAGCSIGDEIEAEVFIGGREWTNPQGQIKYFPQIDGSKISVLATANQSAMTAASVPAPSASDDDDLPFTSGYIMYGWV